MKNEIFGKDHYGIAKHKLIVAAKPKANLFKVGKNDSKFKLGGNKIKAVY